MADWGERHHRARIPANFFRPIHNSGQIYFQDSGGDLTTTVCSLPCVAAFEQG